MLSELSVFSSDEKDKLAALVYAAGIFISHADDTDESDFSEIAEHEALIKTLRSLECNAEIDLLVRQLVSEVLERSEKWSVWEKRAQHLLQDVPVCLNILRRHHMNDRVILHFKKIIMLVAKSTAKAYREEGDEAAKPQPSFWSNISKTISEFMLSVNDKKSFESLSISPQEDAHITELYAALKNN